MPKGYKPAGKKADRPELLSIETTVHMHKYLKGRTFKKRAPFAVKVLRKVAKQFMGTDDNRVDVRLNKHVWSQGIKGCPVRIRIRLDRRKNEDEDAKNDLYTVCTLRNCTPPTIINTTLRWRRSCACRRASAD